MEENVTISLSEYRNLIAENERLKFTLKLNRKKMIEEIKKNCINEYKIKNMNKQEVSALALLNKCWTPNFWDVVYKYSFDDILGNNPQYTRTELISLTADIVEEIARERLCFLEIEENKIPKSNNQQKESSIE